MTQLIFGLNFIIGSDRILLSRVGIIAILMHGY